MIKGPSLPDGGFRQVKPNGANTVLVYLFSDADRSLREDLSALEALADEDVGVYGVLVESKRYDRDSLGRLVEATGASFPIIDATRQPELWDVLGIQTTPLLVVCDDLLSRRARIAGPVDQGRLDRAIDEVWAVHELLWMGGAASDQGVP